MFWGYSLTRQEVVDGLLITTSCPPSSNEEGLLILYFNSLSFLVKLDAFALVFRK